MDSSGSNLGVRLLATGTQRNRREWWGAFPKSKIISDQVFQNKYPRGKGKKMHSSMVVKQLNSKHQIHFQSIAQLLLSSTQQ